MDKVFYALAISCWLFLEDFLDFVVSFFIPYNLWRWSSEIQAMHCGFRVRFKQGVVEYWVNLHLWGKFKFTVCR